MLYVWNNSTASGPGACLLCYSVAVTSEAVNSSIPDHSEGLEIQPMMFLKVCIFKRLAEQLPSPN